MLQLLILIARDFNKKVWFVFIVFCGENIMNWISFYFIILRIMAILTKLFHLFMELLVEFIIVLFVYALVSFLQKKLSKKGKWKFSIKETLSEAWPICFVIALVIVLTNHIF